MARRQNQTKTERASDTAETPPPAYFLSLAVENVRCFGERQTLELSDGSGRPRQWTILLGENGVGKTTLLQCLANLQPYKYPASDSFTNLPVSVFTPHTLALHWMYDSFARHGKNFPLRVISNLSLGVELSSGQTGEKVEDWGYSFDSKDGTTRSLLQNLRGLICYGYGASRRMGTADLSESQSRETCLTLFEDEVTLINAEEWLLQADYAANRLQGKAADRLQRVIEILKNLLPGLLNVDFRPTEWEPNKIRAFAETMLGWVPIKDMSLGYRTTLTWMVDFASRLFDRYPDSENPLAEPAIALIDEIDLHLHPRWQRDLLGLLSKTFPNTQFIVTAHSPLVVQAAPDANVVLLRREGDHVVIENDHEQIRNWRVDQILTSDLFGRMNSRPPQTQALIAEQNRILSKPKLTEKDKKRLRELEAEVGSMPVGETLLDIETMELVREAAKALRNRK